jgi:hypothetical protein
MSFPAGTDARSQRAASPPSTNHGGLYAPQIIACIQEANAGGRNRRSNVKPNISIFDRNGNEYLLQLAATADPSPLELPSIYRGNHAFAGDILTVPSPKTDTSQNMHLAVSSPLQLSRLLT